MDNDDACNIQRKFNTDVNMREQKKKDILSSTKSDH